MNTRIRLILGALASATLAFILLHSPARQPASAPLDSHTVSSTPEQQDIPKQMSGRLISLMRAETDPARREAAAQEGARHLPRALLPAVLANLKNETDRSLATEATRAILLRWSWEEPTGAAAWVTQFAEGDIRRDALAAVGAGWARQNPEALLTWASTLPVTERDWTLLHGASYLARTDLNLFAIWQKALPPTRELAQLTAQTAREWAARDPKAVAAAIGEFSSPENAALRKSLVAGLANQLSQADQFATATAVLDALPPGEEKQHVLKGVALGWARRDPVVVATWLDNVVDKPLRTEMSVLLTGLWLERDPAAAEKWALAQPPGPLADAVAERAAQFYAPRDRAAAQRWTDRISSAEARSLSQSYVQAAQPLLPTP